MVRHTGKKASFIAALLMIIMMISLSSAAPSSGMDQKEDRFLITRHSIDVAIDLEARKVTGSEKVFLRNGPASLRLFLRAGSDIDGVEYGGRKLGYSIKEVPGGKIKEIVIRTEGLEAGADGPAIDISFHGSFGSIEIARENIRRGVAFVEDGVMGPEGAFLPESSAWYPREDGGLPSLELKVSIPDGYSSVAEGELTGARKENGVVTEVWRTDKPVEGIDLVVGRYTVARDSYKGIGIYTYFFQKDDALSRVYLDKTKYYLGLYEEMIGPYPFKKFAVVENFLPTGYGMPSFTLLGSSVIRLPFIPDTSLGHEIAHSWWGNSVFIDPSLGNWSEAVTTYTADYLYIRNDEKKARDFRLGKLKGYKNFAASSPLALKDFTDATATAHRAVGYNKGLMVFNMLERLIGPDDFKKGLKALYSQWAFRQATWKDLEASFEKASGRDLKWFFDQWVMRPGGPTLSIEEATVEKKDGGYAVSFTLKQASPAYILDLPVEIKTEGGVIRKDLRVGKESERVSFETSSTPLSFEIDPGNEVFRILSDREVPPSFASFFGDPGGVIIIPNMSRSQETYFQAANNMAKDYNLQIMTDADIGRKGFLSAMPLMIMGGPGENIAYSLLARHFSNHITINGGSYTVAGKTYERPGSVVAIAIKNPDVPGKALCLLIGDEREAVTTAVKRLRYFAEWSYMVFTPDGKPDKGSFGAEKALGFDFGKKGE